MRLDKQYLDMDFITSRKIIVYFFLFASFSITCIGQKVANMEGIEIGDKAPEIDLKRVSGEEFSLSQLKGKLVYVNFWASWCAPCRKKSPEYLEIYNKYKDSKFEDGEAGFEIVYVSLDKNMKVWKKAILKDNIEDFIHVGDIKGWKSDVAMAYNIKRIPSSVLLDGNSNIIEMNLGTKDLNKKLRHLKRSSFFDFFFFD